MATSSLSKPLAIGGYSLTRVSCLDRSDHHLEGFPWLPWPFLGIKIGRSTWVAACLAISFITTFPDLKVTPRLDWTPRNAGRSCWTPRFCCCSFVPRSTNHPPLPSSLVARLKLTHYIGVHWSRRNCPSAFSHLHTRFSQPTNVTLSSFSSQSFQTQYCCKSSQLSWPQLIDDGGDRHGSLITSSPGRFRM